MATQNHAEVARFLMDPRASLKNGSRDQQTPASSSGGKINGKMNNADKCADIPRFDPRVLLNPKGGGQARKSKEGDSTRQGHAANSIPVIGDSRARERERSISSQSAHTLREGSNGLGMAGQIERMYGVEDRTDRPQKRRKVESEESVAEEEMRRKGTFRGGNQGGEIGGFLKQKRDEAKQKSVSQGSVVDLTAGDDGDDIVIVSDSSQKEVCYGRLGSASVQAHMVPSPSPVARALDPNFWPVIKAELRRRGEKTVCISVIDPTGRDFGTIATGTAIGLAPLMDANIPGVRLQARIPSRQKKYGEHPGAETSGYYDIHINCYGPRKYAQKIGRWLSQKQIWFRTPSGVDAGVETLNPHADKVQALPRATTTNVYSSSSVGYNMRTVEEIRSDVMGMFDTLQRSEGIPEMEADERVLTPLLSHQKQALHFMREREKDRVYGSQDDENSSLWRQKCKPNGQVVYTNVISDTEEKTNPPEVYGGILADMMGLGKTLSVLSLIAASMEQAQEWASQKPPRPDHSETTPLLRNSKATLLVAPLSTIANWEEQIRMHVQEGTMSFHIYHGSYRCEDIQTLADYDIVITTYAVVASELAKRSKKFKSGQASLLEQTNWFRIVLDEAHMIREQATRQSQAICSLSAQRRWAVTGTPVQNRLDDLGALLKFIRLKPFDTKSGFSQYILSPFKQGDPEVPLKLRVLVDSVTLRRLKDKIDLPPRKDQMVKLDFNDDERRMHDVFLYDSQLRIGLIAGEQRNGLGGKTYVHVLRAILRLRLICAHGRELLGDDDLKILEGHSASNAINLEDDGSEKPVLEAKQAYDMYHLMKETNADNCNICEGRIGSGESGTDDASEAKEAVAGYMTPCFQLICKECMKSYKDAVKANAVDENHAHCPLCRAYIRISFFELSATKINEDVDAKVEGREIPKGIKKLGKYGGPHTKTKALLHSLQESEEESSRLGEDESPVKSVVFSGWTSHLDLIQIALEDNKINYVRLDGKMSRMQRNASLEKFREDPDVRVILVSITAGGLGLNLTSASKVYVMEPQFNPAAEAQAIDRVHRLGQKRNVITTRFIMQNSFEQKILDLQEKKTKLAEMAVSHRGGKLDKGEASKRKMEELRSMFK